MTTLEPSARLENLKKSVEVYLETELAGPAGLIVDWEGAASSLGGAEEWLQPRLLAGGRQFHRQVGASTWGESFYFLVSVNIFCWRTGADSAARLYELRDLVAASLYPGTTLDLKDYETTPPQSVGTIKVHEVVTDQAVPTRPADPAQYNFTVRAYHLAQWSLSA